MIKVAEIRCKSCGICIEFCPEDVLEITNIISEKGFRVAGMKNPEKCTGCGICALVCPDAAISVYKEK